MDRKPDPSLREVEGDQPIRLVSLSDGVFATVLTLLVLDLKLPDIVQSVQVSPAHFMAELFPHIFSYFLTFLVGGTYWLAHHRAFDRIVRYDRNLLWYNLMFLLFVGLLPFSTAAYSSNQDSSFLYTLYATDLFLVGIMLALTWAYAVVHHLTNAGLPSQITRYEFFRNLITPAISLFSIGISYLVHQSGIAQFSYLLIPLVNRALSSIILKPESRPSRTAFSFSALLWRLGSSIPLIILVLWTTWYFMHR